MTTPLSGSRREFLRKSLGGAVLFCAGEGVEPLAAEPAAGSSRVAVARDEKLRGAGSTVDSSRVLALLDRAMAAWSGRERAADAWAAVVMPGEMVSLKVNTLGGRGIATNPVLVEAVCERLRGAGVKPADITVWDRDTEELERGGFTVATGGDRVQCFGTDRVGYEEELAAYGSVGSRLSKILTRRTGLLINMPVLKDHDGAGVTIALKNMYGAIHNPNKYHPNGCNPYVADVNMLAEIRGRMRLTICDATRAMVEGGPAWKPEHSWNANTLLVSRDAVALDATGWRMIERKRAEKGLKTLAAEGRAPLYIATAADAEHRLGMDDPARITVIEA